MLPRLFQFGTFTIPTQGVLVALGLVTALFVARTVAARLTLDPEKVWNLCLLGILTTLLGSKLLLVFCNWADFRAHPMWMLGLVRSGWYFDGGVALALAACLLYALSAGLPLLRTFDAVAPAAAAGHAMACIGSFAAGSTYGRPTDLPWGVVYGSPWAARWSGTPLGVRVHPVQLYEAAAEALIFLLLLWLLRFHADRASTGNRAPRIQNGEVAGAWLFLFGLAHFFVEFYRGEALEPILEGSLSADQLLAVGMVIAGSLLWLRRSPQQAKPDLPETA